MAGGERHEEEEEDRVIDLRAAIPGAPPVAGAQWDGLHQRWERWDEARAAWVVVGEAGAVRPADVSPLPAALARGLLRGDDLDADRVIDLNRAPTPTAAVPGAQWNEVLARWERWDDEAGAWVEAVGEQASGS